MKTSTTGSIAALAAGALLSIGCAAAAQPAAPAPAAQAAAEAPVDPQQLALAKRLMALLSDQMDLSAELKAMNAQMLQATLSQTPNADRAFTERMMAISDKVEDKMMPDILDSVAEIYARRLTRREMKDSIAFYKSPSGRSVLRKMPLIAGDLGPVFAKWIPRMQAEMVQELCAETVCTPAQRKALAGPPPQPESMP